MSTIDDRIRRILADVLDLDPSAIGDDASPETFDQWDSLRHMNLLVALEEEFGVTFDDDAFATSASFAGARAAIHRLTQRAAA
jgi:acyl carrier protein